MGLLDQQPNQPATQEDLLAILAAVVRAYGMQESTGRGSKAIVDIHEIEAAKKTLKLGNIKIYLLESGIATSLDRPAMTPTNRFVIEVIE